MTGNAVDPVLLTAPRLAAHIGVSYRQLDYWVTRGWLTPASVVGHPSRGAGHRRVFMGAEIVKAEHMGRIVSWGARPQVAAVVAAALAETGEARFGPYTLTYDDTPKTDRT